MDNHLQVIAQVNRNLPYQLLYPVQSTIMTVVDLIVDIVKAIFKGMFSSQNEDAISSNSLLTYDQIHLYRENFNNDPANVAYVLNPEYSNIANIAVSPDWAAYKPGDLEHSFVHRLLQEVNPTLEGSLMPDGIEMPAGKQVLVLPININNQHWTSIQVDFRDNTIRYLDSAGAKPAKKILQVQVPEPKSAPTKAAGREQLAEVQQKSAVANVKSKRVVRKWEQVEVNFNQLIRQQMVGLKDYLERFCPDNRKFQIMLPRADRVNDSPSIIRNGDQHDGWNCGLFIFHYAWLANIMATLPFNQTQAHIWSRRAHIIQVVNNQPQAAPLIYD